MGEKVIEKNSKGSISTTEGIDFVVRNPQGGHIQTHHKKIFAQDQLRSRQ